MGTLILSKKHGWGNRADGLPLDDASLTLVKQLAKAYGVREDLAVGVLTEETTLGKKEPNNPLQLSPDDRPRWDEAKRRSKLDPQNKARHFATMSLDRLLEGLEKFEGDPFKAAMWYHRPADARPKRYDPLYADSVEKYRKAALESGLAEEGKYLPFSADAQELRKQKGMFRTDLVDLFEGRKDNESLGY